MVKKVLYTVIVIFFISSANAYDVFIKNELKDEAGYSLRIRLLDGHQTPTEKTVSPLPFGHMQLDMHGKNYITDAHLNVELLENENVIATKTSEKFRNSASITIDPSHTLTIKIDGDA